MIEQLKKELCEYGDLQVVKAGTVLTIFITGEKLTSEKAFIGIQKAYQPFTKQYPFVEVMKNDENFFLVVLKAKQKEVVIDQDEIKVGDQLVYFTHSGGFRIKKVKEIEKGFIVADDNELLSFDMNYQKLSIK